MKYDLIFYIAKKTGYCEKRLKRIMAGVGLEPNRIVSATSPTHLGEEVTHSLRLCRLTVIIGGLRSPYDDNLETVLSRVFSIAGIPLKNMRKLPAKGASGDSSVGYLIRCKSQMIMALPDDPDLIEQILTGDILDYLRAKLDM